MNLKLVIPLGLITLVSIGYTGYSMINGVQDLKPTKTIQSKVSLQGNIVREERLGHVMISSIANSKCAVEVNKTPCGKQTKVRLTNMEGTLSLDGVVIIPVGTPVTYYKYKNRSEWLCADDADQGNRTVCSSIIGYDGSIETFLGDNIKIGE